MNRFMDQKTTERQVASLVKGHRPAASARHADCRAGAIQNGRCSSSICAGQRKKEKAAPDAPERHALARGNL